MVTQEQLDRIVQVIKRVSNPQALYLFGSYASGTATTDSDLDIAVVKTDINDQYQDAFHIRKELFGSGVAMDLLFIDEKNYDKRHSIIGTVQFEIANKGKRLL